MITAVSSYMQRSAVQYKDDYDWGSRLGCCSQPMDKFNRSIIHFTAKHEKNKDNKKFITYLGIFISIASFVFLNYLIDKKFDEIDEKRIAKKCKEEWGQFNKHLQECDKNLDIEIKGLDKLL